MPISQPSTLPFVQVEGGGTTLDSDGHDSLTEARIVPRLATSLPVIDGFESDSTDFWSETVD